jgi:dihydrofolate synthase/folylpolyglutamate synthase
VAGTNGKTSTARFTAALLHSQGLHVGLYTSPELVYYEERMEIDGQVVSRSLFSEAINTGLDCAHRLGLQVTEFEVLTAAALWLFAQQHVDYAVLEVGLGGRWDATSVVDPKVAVICSIGLDHMNVLGDTLEAIAGEKAAIIKPGAAVVLGPGTANTRAVFLQRCTECGVTPTIIQPGKPEGLSYNGPVYQQANLACAKAAAEAALGQALNLPAAQEALNDMPIPGRFEVLRKEPLLLIDAAHNPQSALILAQSLKRYFGSEMPHTLLLGILADKDVAGIIKILCPLFEEIVCTQSRSPRSVPAAGLAQMVGEQRGSVPRSYPKIEEALAVLDCEGSSVVATGSITIAGAVKRAWQASHDTANLVE